MINVSGEKAFSKQNGRLNKALLQMLLKSPTMTSFAKKSICQNRKFLCLRTCDKIRILHALVSIVRGLLSRKQRN